MASARRLDSGRPSPVPSMAVGWLATRSNGTNSRSRASGGMPSPVSVTLMRSRSPGTGSHSRWTEPPSRLYLTALDSRFSRTCLSRWRSPRTWVAQDTLRADQHDVVLVGQGPDQADRLGGHVGQRRPAPATATAVPASMAAMSSTSLMRPSRCRAPDRMWPRFSRCSAVQVVQLQQLGEPEDGVQRRPQLVAHARQVLALGLVGLLGGELGQAQVLLQLGLLGDVAGHDQEAVGRGQGPAVRLKGEPVPLGVADPDSDRGALVLAAEHLTLGLREPLQVIGMHELRVRALRPILVSAAARGSAGRPGSSSGWRPRRPGW